jgi:hypothetical protein
MNDYSTVIDQYNKRWCDEYDENDCKVNKEIPCLNKKKTGGILLFSKSCGYISNLYEMIRHEGLKMINKKLVQLNSLSRIENCIYDNGCNLHQNILNNNVTKLLNIDFFIDRFHIFNHTKKKCQKYNLDLKPELNLINSQVCEQTFNYFNRIKYMTKHMSKNHFNFFMLLMVDNFNKKKIFKNKKN